MTVLCRVGDIPDGDAIAVAVVSLIGDLVGQFDKAV